MLSRVLTSAGVVAVLAVSGVLAGCSSPGGGGGEEETVTWWSPNWDTPIAKGLAAKFEEENPGIKIKMVETAADTLANKTSVALDSGTTPDVITELASRTQGYIAKDQLTDVDHLFDSDMPKDDFLDGALTDVSKDDVAYAVPTRWDNVGLIYNKDMFDDAGISGPPTTVEEFEDISKKLTKGDVTGTGWPLGQSDNTVLRFFGLAASTVDDPATNVDGVANLTESSSEEALDVLAGSVKDGWASKSSLEVDTTGLKQLFQNGQIAMYFGGVYDVVAYEEAGMNIGTAILPGFDGYSKSAANGWVYLIPKEAKNADAAEKLVTFLTEPDNMAELTITFPARASAAEDPKFHTETVEPFFEQLSDYAIPAPYDPSWTKLQPELFSAVQSVALGKATSAEAAKAIQTAAEAASK